MTEDFTYYGPALTGRHPHIGPMQQDATILQPAEMAALRASLAALEAALVAAEAERVRLVARAAAAEAQLAAVPVGALREFVRMAGIVEVARDEDEEAQFDALTDRVMAWADPTWQPEVQP